MIKTKNKDAEYWENRYSNDKTGWDMHQISPPLKHYFNQLQDKDIKILIPGCGNAYEAEYLIDLGFTDVHVLDIAIQPLINLQTRIGKSNALHIHHTEFFEFYDSFDLIIEQTFFCALKPDLRSAYADKMKELLNKNGRLVGLLFDFPLVSGPPYGGNINEYYSYFEHHFFIKTFQRAYNSYHKRFSKEIFINLVKK